MLPPPLPRGLRKILDLVEVNPCRAWTVPELAALAGVAPRTLQKHFRHFLQCTPLEFLHGLRLDRARRDLLQASPGANVTETATRWGFSHLGRFAIRYRNRYGESPSATAKRRQRASVVVRRLPLQSAAVERPAIAVLPFDLVGPATRLVAGLAEEIATALSRLGWLTVTRPASARYHLRGKACDGSRSQLRVAMILVDAATGRYLWTHRWEGNAEQAFAFQEHIASCIAASLQSPLRETEVGRATRKDPTQLNAWELTMRALPGVLSFEASGEAMALELLEQAMGLAPQDPLPVALAAWCHGLRAGHHFAPRTDQEKNAAQMLAARAARLNTGDAMTETLLAAGYALAHDLTTAAMHIDRALAIDGSSAWAWSRSGWIQAYGGEADEAIERFQIARALAPDDRLNWLGSIGTAVAHFAAGRYAESIRWYERGLLEHPSAIWCHKSLAPAYELAGRKEEARRSLAKLLNMYPDLTIAHVKRGLPMSAGFLDRAAEGLESAGMRLA
jgi:AraC-like DNA-binding protein/tetratricopeptide (TPR) repeat protein